MGWIDISVVFVVVMQVRVAVVPLEMDGVLWSVYGLEGAGDQRHELAEDADAAVPEGGLGEAPHVGPGARGWVVGLHHIRQLERIVVPTRHKETAAQRCNAASYMDLSGARNE